MVKAAAETVTIERARVELSDVVSRVQYAGERVVVTRRGKPAAAIVPLEDLELLQKIEDDLDADAVREALAEARAGKARPWSEVRESLGVGTPSELCHPGQHACDEGSGWSPDLG